MSHGPHFLPFCAFSPLKSSRNGWMLQYSWEQKGSNYAVFNAPSSSYRANYGTSYNSLNCYPIYPWPAWAPPHKRPFRSGAHGTAHTIAGLRRSPGWYPMAAGTQTHFFQGNLFRGAEARLAGPDLFSPELVFGCESLTLLSNSPNYRMSPKTLDGLLGAASAASPTGAIRLAAPVGLPGWPGNPPASFLSG